MTCSSSRELPIADLLVAALALALLFGYAALESCVLEAAGIVESTP